MGMNVEQLPVNNKGASRDTYYARFYGRVDLTPNLVHLTKPSISDVDNIYKKHGGFNDKALIELNLLAVDTLIKILKEGTINGSTTQSGYIVGNRTAACFQELPIEAIKQNIEIEEEMLKRFSFPKVRYCGVGLSFDRFYIYDQGGRPVIYEETEVAKKLLNYNKDEYWRIVNLKLEWNEPYIGDLFTKTGPIKTKDLETTILDFTHEREWRVPDFFSFNLVNDFTLNKHINIILKDRDTYNYFIQKLAVDGQEVDTLYDKTSEQDIFKEKYIEQAKKENKDIYELEEEIGDEIYKDDFYKKLTQARENDRHIIDIAFEGIEPNSQESRSNYHITILDEI